MKKLRYALPLIFIFPYIVGFSPPDTVDGIFIGFAGGKGIYPTATCSDYYRNHYRETAVSIDRRTSIGGGGHFTFGASGEIGTHQSLLVSTNGEDGGVRGTRASNSMNSFGGHLGLDWKWFGVDFGAVYAEKLGGLDTLLLLPRGSIRIGSPSLYMSSSFLEGRPLL